MDNAMAEMVKQGGYAVLAAFAIYTIWQVSKAWVRDVQSSAERERQLTQQVFSTLSENAKSAAALAAAIALLSSEVQGFRTNLHAVASQVNVITGELEEERLRARNPVPLAR